MVFGIMFSIHRFSLLFMSSASHFYMTFVNTFKLNCSLYSLIYHQQGTFQIIFCFSMIIIYIPCFWYLDIYFIIITHTILFLSLPASSIILTCTYS